MNLFGSPVAIITAAAFVVSCSSTAEEGDKEISQIEVTPETGSLNVGESLTLKAVARDADGEVIPGVTFDWESSDRAVADVADGVVTAASAGEVEIIASAEGKESSPSVIVVAA